MKTVHDLRKEGHKVRVTHYRYLSQPNLRGERYLSCKGGATMIDVTIMGAHGKRTEKGVACFSPEENYNRKLGVRIALGRAFKKLGLPTK